jgi:hypothetical protein
MAFSNFTLPSVLEKFGLTMSSRSLFDAVAEVQISGDLQRSLKKFGQLALRINTEKARSEWLIAPLMGEVWARCENDIYVLSGVDFNVDAEAGLTGVVDFMIGRGPQVSFVPSSPLLAVVEAKNESIPGGQGQCVAEMVAAQRFNLQVKNNIETVYGVVTNGNNWRFHQLTGKELTIDLREYLISEADQILGNLLYVVGHHPTLSKSA